jgi:hypothetical protein
MEWDSAYGSLHAAEARFEASGCTKRPLRRLKCCDPAGRGCPSLTPCETCRCHACNLQAYKH